MIQPFCSVYTKDYRSFDRGPEDDVAKPCLYFSDLKENFLPLEDSKTIYNPERDEAVIKELHLRRLVTTYQKYHCASVGKKSLVIDPDDLDADEFMVYFNNYFKKRTQAIPSPLYTSRRVFGYSRFDDYYTGITTYQEEISKEAYEFFKRDYDQGLSRLFRKKQEAKHKLRKEAHLEENTEANEPTKQESRVKEKVCALCCEKFGDFYSNVPTSGEKEMKSENENENQNGGLCLEK